MKDIITQSELTAVSLLMDAGRIGITTEPINYHQKADEIIMLAEKIKAERLTASMIK